MFYNQVIFIIHILSLQIVLDILCLLHLQVHFSIDLSISEKQIYWITLKIQINLGKIAIALIIFL